MKNAKRARRAKAADRTLMQGSPRGDSVSFRPRYMGAPGWRSTLREWTCRLSDSYDWPSHAYYSISAIPTILSLFKGSIDKRSEIGATLDRPSKIANSPNSVEGAGCGAARTPTPTGRSTHSTALAPEDDDIDGQENNLITHLCIQGSHVLPTGPRRETPFQKVRLPSSNE